MATYCFGGFEYDSAAGRLEAGGQVRTLRPKSARLLAFLIENRERVVGREEIQSELWDGSTVSFDNSIEACVRDVRKALGDPAAEPAFIKTHPRRGYQFIAAVEELKPDNARPFNGVSRRYAGVIAGFVAALAAAGVVFFGWLQSVSENQRGNATAAVREKAPMVAVLPSQQASSEAASDAAFVSESAIAELTRYAPQLLRVLSGETTMALRRQAPVSPERLSDLGVTHILWLTPSADKSGWFKVELTDLSDNGALFSTRFRVDDASTYPLALDIARILSTTREMEVASDSVAGDKFRVVSPLAPGAARRDYSWGRNAYYRGDIQRARDHFESALHSAPNSSALLSAYAYALSHGDDAAMADKARAAAARAIELNAANAEALVVLGNLSVSAGDMGKAQRYFSSAREIAPGMAQLRHGLAAYSILADEYDVALKEIGLAEELDPLAAPVIGDSAWFFLLAGRFDESARRCAQLEAILGAHLRVKQCEFNAYFENGSYKAAAATVPDLMALGGAEAAEIAGVQDRRPRVTLDNYWRWRLSRLGAQKNWRSDDFAAAGRIYAALGEDGKSIKAFEKALSNGSRTAPFILRLKSLVRIRRQVASERSA